jgi:hypothetical protein
MRDDADEQQALGGVPVVAVRLRDVLWVPGGGVSRFPIPHALRIADATVEEMPQINWGAAILAATYRGLRVGCTKMGTYSILLGCPFLPHLWRYSGFPLVGHRSTDRRTGS